MAPSDTPHLALTYPCGYIERVTTTDPFPRTAERRTRILTLVADSLVARGYPPTQAELAEQLQVSKLQVRRALDQLEADGKIERDPGVTRGIRLPD